MTDFKEEAEKHWKFVEELLRNYSEEENKTTVSMEATHFLYVQAMMHGYKHAKEECVHG